MVTAWLSGAFCLAAGSSLLAGLGAVCLQTPGHGNASGMGPQHRAAEAMGCAGTAYDTSSLIKSSSAVTQEIIPQISSEEAEIFTREKLNFILTYCP